MSEEAVPPAGGQCDCDRVPDYLLYAFVASTIVLFILILCLAVAVAVLYRKGKPIAPEQSTSLHHRWWKRRKPSDVVTNSTLLEVARELRREIDHLRRHELGHDLWSQPQPHGRRWSDGEIRLEPGGLGLVALVGTGVDTVVSVEGERHKVGEADVH